MKFLEQLATNPTPSGAAPTPDAERKPTDKITNICISILRILVGIGVTIGMLGFASGFVVMWIPSIPQIVTASLLSGGLAVGGIFGGITLVGRSVIDNEP